MPEVKKYFVTGIGTDVGKTICSAILVEALKADYWKPVQAGGLDFTDTDKVRSLISNTQSCFHPERYRLLDPMSPHAAANREGITVSLKDFALPLTSNSLIVEGAGGLMVPLNNAGDLVIDLIQTLRLEVILVSQNYLGSINHSLLSIEALHNRKIPVAGILFNGEPNAETEKILCDLSGLPIVGNIPRVTNPDKKFVIEQAGSLRKKGILGTGF